MRRQPVLFVSHGAPTHALDTGPYSASLRRFGDALTGEARPSAIAVVSAHWQVRGLDHGAWVPLRLALPDASIPVVQVSLPAVPPEALVRWQRLAPNPARAHPHSDHFDPLLVALGAAWPGERAESIFEGIAYATLSLRTFAFRPAAA